MSLTVLQIIPALGTGGAEQACVDIAGALMQRGDAAIVVSSGGRRVAEVEKAGARHVLCEVATKNPIHIIQNAFWLAKVIKSHHVDVVHARSRAPAWSAWLACRMTGCSYVTTFHAAYKFSSLPKKFYNRVMARGARVIAVSPFIQRHIHENYGVPLAKIPLVNRGVDIDALTPTMVSQERKDTLLKDWGLKATDKIILLPGRLSPIKNHELIIEAMVVLKRQKKALPVVCFVGDDQGRLAYSEGLHAHIRKASLTKHVKLVGACSDMPAALSFASLVVMPSKIPEGFGRVPVESMAMGVPVIASNLGATQDTVIEGETGWLLPPKDPVLWAQRIEQALSLSPSEHRRMAQIARAYVEDHFSDHAMVAQTLAVYDDVSKESHKK
ncbi:MAG: glycosyltransferase family 4 protein [Alphaproteobacteria bacterium]|nr:glycosyltransferase family 4 protein [Alphaproteobacteria bacterium]